MSRDATDTQFLQPYSSTLPNSQSSNSKGDGPFDPANTPPLILAFIAVGFLIFGLVVVAIHKRCRPPPDSQDSSYQRASTPSRRPSTQKPRLWDVRMTSGQRVPDEERINANDWDAFVPLSASLVYPYSPSPPVHVPQQYVQGHVARPTTWDDPERRLFFRRPPADTSIHLAVTISMPKPPQQHQESVPDRTCTESEFCVGVTEVKWSR